MYNSGEVEDTEQTGVQDELRATYFDTAQIFLPSVDLAYASSIHQLFANYKPADVASVLKSFWALSCLLISIFFFFLARLFFLLKGFIGWVESSTISVDWLVCLLPWLQHTVFKIGKYIKHCFTNVLNYLAFLCFTSPLALVYNWVLYKSSLVVCDRNGSWWPVEKIR